MQNLNQKCQPYQNILNLFSKFQEGPSLPNFIIIMSQTSSVTLLKTNGQRQGFFSLELLLDQLCSPPSLLYKWCWGLFHQGYSSYLVLRISICGAIPLHVFMVLCLIKCRDFIFSECHWYGKGDILHAYTSYQMEASNI